MIYLSEEHLNGKALKREEVLYFHSYEYRDEGDSRNYIVRGKMHSMLCNVQPDRRRIEIQMVNDFTDTVDYVKILTSSKIVQPSEEDFLIPVPETINPTFFRTYFYYKKRWYWEQADSDNTSNSRGGKHREYLVKTNDNPNTFPDEFKEWQFPELEWPSLYEIRRYESAVARNQAVVRILDKVIN